MPVGGTSVTTSVRRDSLSSLMTMRQRHKELSVPRGSFQTSTKGGVVNAAGSTRGACCRSGGGWGAGGFDCVCLVKPSWDPAAVVLVPSPSI